MRARHCLQNARWLHRGLIGAAMVWLAIFAGIVRVIPNPIVALDFVAARLASMTWEQLLDRLLLFLPVALAQLERLPSLGRVRHREHPVRLDDQ